MSQNDQSAGQRIIDAKESTGVRFNIFCVKNFQGIPVSGTTPDHSKAGLAYYPIQLAYVEDEPPPYTLHDIAHEIGHLLDLAHPDFSFRPSLVTNNADLQKVPDPSPTDRLMWGEPVGLTGTNSRLIQTEWDIVNPNTGSQ